MNFERANVANGSAATRHQREVGRGHFDIVGRAFAGGVHSTAARDEAAEAAQFSKEAA